MYTLCSGFVIDKYINPKSFLYKTKRKNEIKKLLSKRNDIPDNIKKALIEMPQYEIFFENFTPYYRENNSPDKKELPMEKGLYYDPVKSTKAYKLVIKNVKAEAQKEYDKFLADFRDGYAALGDVHKLISIESEILYKKYGIKCINNPMTLNPGVCVD